jgi:hypothetical protein
VKGAQLIVNKKAFVVGPHNDALIHEVANATARLCVDVEKVTVREVSSDLLPSKRMISLLKPTDDLSFDPITMEIEIAGHHLNSAYCLYPHRTPRTT